MGSPHRESFLGKGQQLGEPHMVSSYRMRTRVSDLQPPEPPDPGAPFLSPSPGAVTALFQGYMQSKIHSDPDLMVQ